MMSRHQSPSVNKGVILEDLFLYTTVKLGAVCWLDRDGELTRFERAVQGILQLLTPAGAGL
jgi:predicted molibdopterin-dependent oxidoreductase YjgC